MDKQHEMEMLYNFEKLGQTDVLEDARIYLFGHCHATEVLADNLMDLGYTVQGILDNNISKQGQAYKTIGIYPPTELMEDTYTKKIVLIVARASAAMTRQLRKLGYEGRVERLIEYNSYAEYSLAPETIHSKEQRVERGRLLLKEKQEKYGELLRIYCPFQALGDVYYAMAYLPYYLQSRGVDECVVFVIGRACKAVAEMFGWKYVEALTQQAMDEQIQAVIYTQDKNAFIPHQDRPYIANIYKALSVKCIPLEMMYKCGVYGLEQKCRPYRPSYLQKYARIEDIPKNRAVILSPHAKSVTNIPEEYWEQIIAHFTERGYEIYTNVTSEEKELTGTKRLEATLGEMISVVERAGWFIGLRSGLCDVISGADCKKIALYPDCYYSDTQWKMAEIYHLDGWTNIVV